MSRAETTKTLGAADIGRVLKLLPHRYPFLMLDRIYDMDGDESCVGIKNVTINEPFFQGHFPAVPGDAGRAHHRGPGADGGRAVRAQPRRGLQAELVYFMGIDRAKFRKPVLPGDQLHYHVQEDPQPRPRLAVLRRSEGRRPDGGRGGGQRHAGRYGRGSRIRSRHDKNG